MEVGRCGGSDVGTVVSCWIGEDVALGRIGLHRFYCIWVSAFLVLLSTFFSAVLSKIFRNNLVTCTIRHFDYQNLLSDSPATISSSILQYTRFCLF